MIREPKRLVGWRYAAAVGGFVGLIGVFIYPVIISPMIDPDYYKRLQSEGRKGIKQEDIQPGNMKVWSDPFQKK